MKVTLGILVVLALFAPATAGAEIRSGTATRGDDHLGSGQTFTGISASYEDQGGRIEATVAFPDPLGTPSVLHVYFRSDPGCGAGPGDIEMRTLTSGSDSAQNQYALTIYSRDLPSGQAYGTKTTSGQQINVYFADPKLATLDLQCVVVQTGGLYYDSATMTPIPNPPTFATLDPPLYFAGFGPDSDGDGVKDNLDQCPAATGPSPTGCPAATTAPPPPPAAAGATPGSTTPAPRCRRPNVKGKTLKAATALIKKRHCTLGKVTRPKRVRRGATLVVKKQSGSTRIALTLGVKARRR